MVTTRSDRVVSWLLASAGLLAVFAGVAGMWSAARFAAAQGWGLRSVLVSGEMALLAIALLAVLSLGLPLGWRRGAAVRLVPRGVLAGLALWVGSLGVVGLQQLLWPPPPGYLPAFLELHRALRPAGPLDALASLAAVALAPALCEELLFRGVALPALVPLLRPWGAAFASALLFGLIHVDAVGDELSLYRAPFAFAVGLGLAALRLRSGSMVPPILAHAALNACTWGVTLVALLTLGPDVPPPEEAGPPALAAAQLAVGFLALFGLVRRWPAPRA
jgi:membrane protease YdiL (CAAX protease family)